ncbi:MAG: alpha/beta hydrolase-fold protein [Pseudomonadota bacterium]
MKRSHIHPAGQFDSFRAELPRLQGNLLGETQERDIGAWWPAGLQPNGLPLVVCLASYLNTGPSLTGWRAFGETLPERLDRLYGEGRLGPVTVVFIDSYNRLGGNQFVNSPIIGNWCDALADDLIPLIEARYGCGGAGRRGVFGHSSGGFGALHNLAMRPDVWSAAASHAGDCGFELVYKSELYKALRVLAGYDFKLDDFLDQFWLQEKPKGDQISALMMLAMAASYDPSDDRQDHLRLRLPVTLDTGEIIPARWANWIAHDPLSFAAARRDAFASAAFLYFDCGTQDEYNILYGSRRLSQLFSSHNIAHDFREFDGGHGTIGPRYEVSLPLMVSTLSCAERSLHID